MTTPRQENEQVIARLHSLNELTEIAKEIVQHMQSQKTLYDPYKPAVKLDDWLKGSWHKSPLAQRTIHSSQWHPGGKIESLHYCLSDESIEYLLSMSTNQYEFWSFVALATFNYSNWIRRRKGHNDAERSSEEYYAKTAYPRKAELLPIPELPISAEDMRTTLEQWSTFGQFVNTEFDGYFDYSGTNKATLLDLDLDKDLNIAQMVFLATNRLILLTTSSTSGWPREQTISLHPLARAILTAEATKQEKANEKKTS